MHHPAPTLSPSPHAPTQQHLKRPASVRHRLATLSAAAALLAAGAAAQAEGVIGLTTTNALIRLDSAMPTQASAPVQITGLAFNERIIGIDLRPSTGMLYGVSNQNRLFTLNANTGMASFVAVLVADPSDASSPFMGFKSQALGIDFNPVPDLGQTLPSLRITSTAGENLRVNVNAANAGRVFTDTDLNGPGGGMPSIAGSAYINNDRNAATGTTLYNIDTAADALYVQTPPNAGTQVLVGSLGIDAIGVTGFDVSGATGMAYAAMTDSFTGKSGLYTIALNSGMATWVGDFGIGGNTAIAPPLLDLTVAAIPEPGSYALMAAGLLGLALRRRALLRKAG
jgi:hypothetical protein